MYELVQVSEQCYYINCPAKIGVYAPDKDNVYLIDSGNDKDAGRKVRRLLQNTRFWSHPSFMAAIPVKTCGINS